MVLLLSLLAVSVAATEAAKWVDPPPRYVCPDRPLYPCVCIRGGDDGLRLECSNTNLASLALGLRQVRSLIHTLRISNCNIERLYGNVFRSLSVRKLYVEDTPVKDISDGTFDELMADSMEELHLTNSWLTRVPPSLKNLTNLKVLQIEKSRIRYLPPGVFDGMTKLQDLKLADGGISQVTEHTFAGLKKLKRLSLFRVRNEQTFSRPFHGSSFCVSCRTASLTSRRTCSSPKAVWNTWTSPTMALRI